MRTRVLTSCFIFFLGLIIVQTTAFSQEKLADKVEAAIANSFYEDFTVTASEEGNVTLEGNVNSLYDKYRIFEIASRVPVVRKISNQVTVNTPVIADKMIEANILQEMKYVSSILEPDRISVRVNNGVVFLDGKVSFYREKIMMKTIASWQKGVKGIVNKLAVLPPKKAKSDENLMKVLNQIMKHEFPIEDNIQFTIDDGNVTLKGTATSLWAKNNIEEEFLNVIGIKDVENNLDVKPIM